MVRRNPLRELWERDRTAFGLWATVPGSFGAELLAGAGFDYLCVDQQHGVLDYAAMVPMLQAARAAGAAPLTRVLSGDPALVTKALDAGAWGVIVPLVSDGAAAARVVSACRFPPRGSRSYGPVRAAEVIGSADPEVVEREALCFVMVETAEGVGNVEEIAATPGLDGIYIGPADLSLSLGSGELERAVGRIREACEDAGIVPGIHCFSGEEARRRAEEGFRLVTVTSDAALLREGARRELAAARRAPSR
ncbi:2-dehydro-3,6-dideoxy-6-sulfogluconate aldolase [Rubrobacter xylanophilus DSM 9941]|uniref:HpcH/HpaI aldolase family protein n=1 Tax=Rubrobacter xylanophilus TaxID=49319 RepID=UPI001C63CC5F|nr:aldolase/citrate lyase family protein [Rubrobacter xylanophilus]QYJ16033.1 2-dehydro-3,6-dideoxy-6-sulfogluconate aldolase [Rubrobacter xylanophilus DSM 9941]